jgi:hypothetical protein
MADNNGDMIEAAAIAAYKAVGAFSQDWEDKSMSAVREAYRKVARAVYAVLSPSLLEQGVRLGLEAADRATAEKLWPPQDHSKEITQWNETVKSVRRNIRALDPAAIAKERLP